jgi:hypothetical protein
LSSGEKVLSPIVFGAKRSLSKALNDEARVSNSLKKKKHQNQKQTSLHDYIDGKETPAMKNVDGKAQYKKDKAQAQKDKAENEDENEIAAKSDAWPNDDTDEMSVSDIEGPPSKKWHDESKAIQAMARDHPNGSDCAYHDTDEENDDDDYKKKDCEVN